jgi:hypothetical protein
MCCRRTTPFIDVAIHREGRYERWERHQGDIRDGRGCFGMKCYRLHICMTILYHLLFWTHHDFG